MGFNWTWSSHNLKSYTWLLNIPLHWKFSRPLCFLNASQTFLTPLRSFLNQWNNTVRCLRVSRLGFFFFFLNERKERKNSHRWIFKCIFHLKPWNIWNAWRLPYLEALITFRLLLFLLLLMFRTCAWVVAVKLGKPEGELLFHSPRKWLSLDLWFIFKNSVSFSVSLPLATGFFFFLPSSKTHGSILFLGKWFYE